MRQNNEDKDIDDWYRTMEDTEHLIGNGWDGAVYIFCVPGATPPFGLCLRREGERFGFMPTFRETLEDFKKAGRTDLVENAQRYMENHEKT